MPPVKRKKWSYRIRMRVASSQDWKCNNPSCKDSKLDETFQLDHIVALANGGLDIESNLQCLCCRCHAKKTYYELYENNNINSTTTIAQRETSIQYEQRTGQSKYFGNGPCSFFKENKSEIK